MTTMDGSLRSRFGRPRAVLQSLISGLVSDRVSLAAAGCAFYATLALFPAIGMLVFVYGLAFDPRSVVPQLALLRDVLPDAAYTLIAQRVLTLVMQERATLGAGLAISTALAFWSAATGTKAIFAALNLAYDVSERRGFLRFQLTALGMTLCAILGAVLASALLVFLPVAIGLIGLDAYRLGLINAGGMLVMMSFVALSLWLLYRFGPCLPDAAGHRVGPGALVATLVWLAASAALSFYIGHVARFDVTYGPLGAVVGVMMWFYVTAYAVLLGAELNAVLERLPRKTENENASEPVRSESAASGPAGPARPG
jgi:membrane protein